MSTPIPIGLDVNVLLNTVLGGITTIAGSLAVAALYIRNQNKNQRKKRMREMIQRDYFDGCLNPTLGALSQYGTNTVFALTDSSLAVRRYVEDHRNETILNNHLKEISSRATLIDLTTHNFTFVSEYLPSLHKFGRPIYTSIFISLQFYSEIAKDATSFDVLRKTGDTSLQEVSRSLRVLSMIVERSLLYLENRFLNMRDYFFITDIEAYNDFFKVFSEKRYTDFLTTIEKYNDGLRDLMIAMKSPNSEDRTKTSMSFSQWLTDNMDINPLVINKEPEKKTESIATNSKEP